jgi:hypothetical protein
MNPYVLVFLEYKQIGKENCPCLLSRGQSGYCQKSFGYGKYFLRKKNTPEELDDDAIFEFFL